MAGKIIWSLRAREDLRDIVTFIAADNPAAAQSFGFRLMSKVDVLANFPQLGRVVPEENDEAIRELILRPYRIVYQVLADRQTVAIVRIWQGHAANRRFLVAWNFNMAHTHEKIDFTVAIFIVHDGNFLFSHHHKLDT